ncbi:MAG TPA: NUDIX domain-containing protein [Candidatus Nanoarchaeia archaeon]|nr:NUDIX domain-containing protein [Candidatus Nanoarchaeia archaeon]
MRTRRTSVKAFIVDSRNHVLILKRALSDPERPYFFEIPGGRLNPHEDLFIGLRREIKEETGLDIEPLFPLSVRHFTRKDGEVISLLSFVCTPLSSQVTLSSEHADFIWLDLSQPLDSYLSYFPDCFYLHEIDTFKKFIDESL